MSEAFVKIDLHGLRQEEAIKVIDQAIASAGPATYHLQLIHGYNRGTSLRSMIYDWYHVTQRFYIPSDCKITA